MDIEEQFNLVAKSYDENRKKFISCFDDYYISSTGFIARTLKYAPKVIYDLGSGTGLLPTFWYKYFPKSEYVLVTSPRIFRCCGLSATPLTHVSSQESHFLYF